ncbi:MAG: insulinase family protein [Nannocystaceae bacterium]|nr:insulinase family protein [Nannocystaceae bacterium]
MGFALFALSAVLFAPTAEAADLRAPTSTDPLAVTSVTLDNGFRVFLTENHERPEVFGAVVVNTGAKNDPSDNTGMAHYLEHMLFKGTTALGTTDWAAEQPHQARIEALYDELGQADDDARKAIQEQIQDEVRKTYPYVVPNELDQMLRRHGGRGVNAFTSYDETVYHNTFPASQVQPWLEIYAHRFDEPVFRLFPSELEAVYEEKNIALDTTGYTAFRKALKAVFPDHPYGGTDILGEVEHLKRPSLRAMRAYFETYYVPQNMALVLSGDFDTPEVLALVRRTFGTWERGVDPPPTPGVVSPFEPNEKLSMRATPIRAGVVAYRTLPERHRDFAALAVIRQLLSNPQRSGLVDRVSDGGKLLYALHLPADFADHNLDAVIYVPRIVTQSIRGAERVASAPFEALAAGEFDEATFAGIKAGLLNDEARRLESNEERALAIGHAFVAHGERAWQGHVQYLSTLRGLTKADVVRVAKQLFGERRLRVRSRMGFPKKARLDKPDVAPVKVTPGAHSEFYQRLTSRPSQPPQLATIDFGTDIPRTRVRDAVTVEAVDNPFNDLFSLEVRFGVGHLRMRALPLVAELIPRLGTYHRPSEDLQDAWAAIDTTMFVEAELDTLIVRLDGPHAHLDEALALLSEVLVSAKPDASIWRKVRRERWGFRRLTHRDPRSLSEALRDHVMYGDLSESYRDYGPAGARRFSADNLVRHWTAAQRYQATVRYAGPATLREVTASVQTGLAIRTELAEAVDPVVLPRQRPRETTVYFLPRRDAVQSHLWFVVDGDAIAPEEAAAADAFAEYFGGSMAGLVFQEIREFRALAYSAGARLGRDEEPSGAGYLQGYVGCQSDKTFDALDVMLGLIEDMPRYEDRMSVVKASLSSGLETSSPGFRERAETLAQWRQRGYSADPRPARLTAYGTLEFADIQRFYADHIQGRPISIIVVGDPRTVKRKRLREYGPLVEVSMRDILDR